MNRWRSFPFLRLFLAVAMAAGVSLAVAAPPAGAVTVGAVFTETNTSPENFIQVFNRDVNGTLTMAGSFSTGGSGLPSSPPFGFPVVDSQGSVVLNDARTLLFAVNAGSNTVSSFAVHHDNSLDLVEQKGSKGSAPISLTVKGHYLYVLNEDSGDIAGYSVDSRGHMTPLAGSVQSLAAPSLPAQIGFDSLGRTLVVTERGNNTIEIFPVGPNGVAGSPTTHPSTGPTPFGFAFTPRNQLLVSNSPNPPTSGSVSSYSVPFLHTDLTPLDMKLTHQLATCWLVTTPSGRYAYATSPVTRAVTGLRVASDGTLQLLDSSGLSASTAGAALDEAMSRDGRFLYVLNPTDLTFTASQIDTFKINADGSLTALGSTPASLPGGSSGLAVK